MEVVNQRCAGLDVHKRNVVACLIVPGADGRTEKRTRTFLTMTGGILELSDWLAAAGCTDVAMESTGVYVRRITARAIPLARRTGSEGNPWVND
jgi:transposase